MTPTFSKIIVATRFWNCGTARSTESMYVQHICAHAVQIATSCPDTFFNQWSRWPRLLSSIKWRHTFLRDIDDRTY